MEGGRPVEEAIDLLNHGGKKLGEPGVRSVLRTLPEITARRRELLQNELEVVGQKLGNLKILTVHKGTELNKPLAIAGKDLAWIDNSQVFLSEIKEEVIAYRVHTNIDNANGAWLSFTDPRQLKMSRKEIKDWYALPAEIDELKYISTLKIPVGTKIYLGEVSENSFGKGGGFQIYIEGTNRVPKSWVDRTEGLP